VLWDLAEGLLSAKEVVHPISAAKV
jgi:hypothetical protein